MYWIFGCNSREFISKMTFSKNYEGKKTRKQIRNLEKIKIYEHATGTKTNKKWNFIMNEFYNIYGRKIWILLR